MYWIKLFSESVYKCYVSNSVWRCYVLENKEEVIKPVKDIKYFPFCTFI